MIKFYPQKTSEPKKFSIIIPTWNNLAFAKLCYNSIIKNSHFKHQIIFHVNDGSDGSLEWVKSLNIDYTYSSENVGICYAMNAMASLAKTDYILYLNDDMYVCPEWDLHLWNEIEKMSHPYFFFSSTMIEPTDTNNPCVIFDPRFGQTVESFKEDLLLSEYSKISKSDWSGSTWPPNIVHKNIWDLVGGYSVEYFPGYYSDPDFSKKLWDVGVRAFKGISASRVYHFQGKSTGRVKKNNGKKQFLRKWDIPSSRFVKEYLLSGQDYRGELNEPVESFSSKLKTFGDKLRSTLSF